MHLSITLVVLIAYGSTCAGLTYSGNGESREYWNQLAKENLKRARTQKPNINVAKNVILFLGDGMGVSTVTAARILKGQLNNKPGEEESLSFEEFPNIALSKTYNQDAQVPDSAGTATAFLSGVKTNSGILGLDGRSRRGDCSTVTADTKLKNIYHWSQEAGKSVGFVTNTRVTHATPGAGYAYTVERDWEGDADMQRAAVDENCGVKDTAAQLIDDNDLNVMMGGGRRTFLPQNETDPETHEVDSKNGRLDGRNLVNVWLQRQRDNNKRHRYVWNQTEFNSVDPDNTDYLLGLFNPSHMQYELDRADDTGGEPSLAEMTEMAIKILRKNAKGFFLLVEGGRIDHAHHETRPVKALHDTLAFADAVQKAVDLTDKSDTLIITTADHSHVFGIGGYPSRGKPIFGLVDNPEFHLPVDLANDEKPYTTLMYTNGPGSFASVNATVRPNVTGVDTADKEYQFQAAVPLAKETHGGEDVAIYARGPMSHLFHVTHEQSYIAHVMAYASCVGEYSSPSQCAQAEVDEQRAINSSPDIFQRSLIIKIAIAAMCVFLCL